MQQTIQRMNAYAEQQAAQAGTDDRHRQLLQAIQGQQADMLAAFNVLLRYLKTATGRTEVVNQPDSIHTPDIIETTKAVNQVADILKTHENTDLSPLISLMERLVSETAAIPKELPSIDIPAEITVKNQVDHTKDLKAIEQAIKAQKTTVEAPNVTVPAPVVNLPAPDLKPVQNGLKDVEKAVRAIKLPEPKESTPAAIMPEPFDEYHLNYDRFSPDDPEAKIESIDYFRDGKKIATIVYEYDLKDRLTGARRV